MKSVLLALFLFAAPLQSQAGYQGLPASGGGGGSVTGVTGTAPIVSSGGAAPVISCTTATDSVKGCISAVDHTALTANTAASHAAVTLGPLGSTPNSKGLTLSGQAVNGELADATHPGMIGTGAQTIAGPLTVASIISTLTGHATLDCALTGCAMTGIRTNTAAESVGTATTPTATLDVIQKDTTTNHGIRLCNNGVTTCYAVDVRATSFDLGQVGQNFAMILNATNWWSFSNGSGVGPLYTFEFSEAAGSTKPTLWSQITPNSGSFNTPGITFRSRATTTNGLSAFFLADSTDNTTSFYGERYLSGAAGAENVELEMGNANAGALEAHIRIKQKGFVEYGGTIPTVTCNSNAATVETGSTGSFARFTAPSSPGTTCVVTIPDTPDSKPHCDATNETGTRVVPMICSSVSSCTITDASLAASNVISFHCGGHI